MALCAPLLLPFGNIRVHSTLTQTIHASQCWYHTPTPTAGRRHRELTDRAPETSATSSSLASPVRLFAPIGVGSVTNMRAKHRCDHWTGNNPLLTNDLQTIWGQLTVLDICNTLRGTSIDPILGLGWAWPS